MPYAFLAGLLVAGGILSAWLVSNLHSSSSIAAGVPAGPTKRAVVFVIEGASPADLQLPGLPNLSSLASSGVSYPNAWVGQLESLPLPSLASLSTGVFPARHGVVGREWKVARTGQLAQAVSSDQVKLGALDQVLQPRGTTPIQSLLRQSQSSSRTLSVAGPCSAASASGTWASDYVLCASRDHAMWKPGAVAGHEPPGGVPAGPSWNAPAVSNGTVAAATQGWDWGSEDAWIGRYAVWEIARTHAKLTIVTFPELNSALHFVPSNRVATIRLKVMRGIDAAIGRVKAELRRERVLGETVFVVTSDQAVQPTRATVASRSLREAVAAAGGQAVYVDAEGSAYIGLHDRLQAFPVAQSIQAERLSNVDAVYYKTRSHGAWHYRLQYINPLLPSAYGDALTYLLGTLATDTAPDVVAVYAPGTGTRGIPVARYLRQGVSSGSQWANQHIPLVVSGNGVPKGGTSNYPARLVDIAPTLATLLGTQTGNFDGVALADSMFQPDLRLVKREEEAGRALTPLVDALRQRSQMVR